jgi:hypothetical protein
MLLLADTTAESASSVKFEYAILLEFPAARLIAVGLYQSECTSNQA